MKIKTYRRHLRAVIIKTAPNMAETRATTMSIGTQVFSLLNSVERERDNKEIKNDIHQMRNNQFLLLLPVAVSITF